MNALLETRFAQIQERMDAIGEDAPPGARAVEVASLGHRTWFAHQEGRTFTLARPSGGIRSDPEKAFTTNSAALKDYRASDTINTVIFDVDDGIGNVRCVFDIEFQKVDVFRIHQSSRQSQQPTVKVSDDIGRPKAAAAPTAVRPVGEALARLSAADLAFAEARETYASAVAKHSALTKSQKDAGERAAKIEAQLGQRLAAEIMADRELADEHPETGRIKRLKLREDATRLALPIAEIAVQQAMAEVERTSAERVLAVLDWAAAEQSLSLAEAKSALAAIVPSLARLAAIDRMKSRFIGAAPKTTDPGHPGLRSTERLAQSVIKGVPPVLLPGGLRDDLFEASVLAEIKSVQTEMEISQ